jgi:hypothetical protein
VNNIQSSFSVRLDAQDVRLDAQDKLIEANAIKVEGQLLAHPANGSKFEEQLVALDTEIEALKNIKT